MHMRQDKLKKARRLSAFLILLLFVSVFAGTILPNEIGQAAAEKSKTLSAHKVLASSWLPAGTLAEEGKLKVGMETNYPPYNWTQMDDSAAAVPIFNSPGEFANGYDVQISKKIAAALGVELQIIKTEWTGLVPALESGKIDLIVAGMSPTAERKAIINFSDIYYYADQVLVVRKDSKWATGSKLSDFKDARLTSQIDSATYRSLSQIQGGTILEAMLDYPTMVTALSAQKIDGICAERPGAMAIVAKDPSLTYTNFAPGEGFQTAEEDSNLAIGMRKGSPLTTLVNNILTEISTTERGQIMQYMVDLNTGTGKAESFFSSVLSIIKTYWKLFLRGAAVTLLIALVGTLLGLLIGILVAILRSLESSRTKPVKNVLIKLMQAILAVYVEVFRGTPLMVQAMLIFFGSKLFFNIDMSSLGSAFFIISINTGAYLAEIVRGGINAVDNGQTEAAKAIGMTHGQTMFAVVLPQALRFSLPAIGNEFVINVKDTSVLNIIMVTELFFLTKSIAGTTLLTFQSYFIASAIYLIMTFTLTRILRLVEKKLIGPENYRIKELLEANETLDSRRKARKQA